MITVVDIFTDTVARTIIAVNWYRCLANLIYIVYFAALNVSQYYLIVATHARARLHKSITLPLIHIIIL